MAQMEHDDWFWDVEGGTLDAEGLDGDMAAGDGAADPIPPPASADVREKKPGRRWGPVDLRGRSTRRLEAPAVGAGVFSLTALRRTRVGLIVAIVLVAAVGFLMLRMVAPQTKPGVSTASSVVDAGADLALEQAAALKVAPVQVDGGPRPPGRLIIPTIGVDAQVIAVGVDKDGNMAVTNESYNVGWYNHGPAPGDPGDAVMDGHLDWYDTSQAVFYNLSKVHIGDDVQVQRLDGSTRHFKVTKVQTVAYNAKVPGLFQSGGAARLSLITCGGQWSRSLNQYLNRVIVDAVLST
jgi:LPXTG-site transpeptidase (sortase) family protein